MNLVNNFFLRLILKLGSSVLGISSYTCLLVKNKRLQKWQEHKNASAWQHTGKKTPILLKTAKICSLQ